MEERQKKSPKLSEIVLVIAILLGFGTVIAGVTMEEPLWAVIGIGIVFFFIGTMAFISSAHKLRDLPVLLFSLIGGLMIGIPGILLYQRTLPPEEIILTTREIMIVVIGIFPFTGVMLLIIGAGGWLYRKMVCTIPVETTCVDIQVRRTRKGRKTYRPTWNYYYNGYDYSVQGTGTNFQVPEVGEIRQLMIHPDKPEIFAIPGDLSPLFITVMGIVFTVAGVMVMKAYLS